MINIINSNDIGNKGKGFKFLDKQLLTILLALGINTATAQNNESFQDSPKNNVNYSDAQIINPLKSSDNIIEDKELSKSYYYSDGTEINLAADPLDKLRNHFSNQSFPYIKEFFDNTIDWCDHLDDEDIKYIFGLDQIINNFKDSYNIVLETQNIPEHNTPYSGFELVRALKTFDDQSNLVSPSLIKNIASEVDTIYFGMPDYMKREAGYFTPTGKKVFLSYEDNQMEVFFHELSHRAQFSRFLKISPEVDDMMWITAAGSMIQNYPYLLKVHGGYYAGEDKSLSSGVFGEFPSDYSHYSPEEHQAEVFAFLFSGDEIDESNLELMRSIQIIKMQYFIFSDGYMDKTYREDLKNGKVNKEYWITKTPSEFNESEWSKEAITYKAEITKVLADMSNSPILIYEFLLKNTKKNIALLFERAEDIDDLEKLKDHISVVEDLLEIENSIKHPSVPYKKPYYVKQAEYNFIILSKKIHQQLGIKL